MDRREFVKIALGGVGISLIGSVCSKNLWAATSLTPISKTEEEWKKMLSDEQFNVLRKEGTERPFSSPLNKEKGEGVFACAGCDLELFDSSKKYDSGTGWPSFFQAIEGHIETKTDYKMMVSRTEYHCARCGGHQGHVFEDGPKPTGLRYCNNGVALKFIPKSSSPSGRGSG